MTLDIAVITSSPFQVQDTFNWASKSSQDSRRYKFKCAGQIIPWCRLSAIFPTFIWDQCLVCQCILCPAIFLSIHTTFTFFFFPDISCDSKFLRCDKKLRWWLQWSVMLMNGTYIFCENNFKNGRTVQSEVTKISPNWPWILLFQCLFLTFVILISELLQWPTQNLETNMMNFWSRTSDNKNTLTLQCEFSGSHNFLHWLVKFHLYLAIPLTHTALGCCPPVVHSREYMKKREQNIITIFITLIEIIYAKAKIWLATSLCQRKRRKWILRNYIHQGVLNIILYAGC